MKKISIGVPCYNESENIEKMYEALTIQMRKFPQYDYEIIFGDNGSNDESEEIYRRIASNDDHVKVIINSANFGPARNGYNIQMSYTGDAYIHIPCDFQEPPELIPEFIKYWEKGYDIVWGHKVESRENPIKYGLRSLFYSIIAFFSEHELLQQVTCFGIVDRKVYDLLLPYLIRNKNISMRFLATEFGFRLKLIDYQQQKRLHGKSSYNVSRYFNYALNALCTTSTKPLRIMTGVGVIGSFISAVVGLIYLVLKLIYWNRFNAGVGPIVIIVAFTSSMQLMGMGILGQYVSVLLERETDLPLVIERERIGFDNDGKKVKDDEATA